MYAISVEKDLRLELTKLGSMEENGFVGTWFASERAVMSSVDVNIVKIGWKLGPLLAVSLNDRSQAKLTGTLTKPSGMLGGLPKDCDNRRSILYVHQNSLRRISSSSASS